MRTPMKARLRVPFLSLVAGLGVTLMSACSGGITSPTALAPSGHANQTGYVVAETTPIDSLDVSFDPLPPLAPLSSAPLTLPKTLGR